MVSGEVLEELKRQPQVTGNGGLIVTFLLEEDNIPAISANATLHFAAASSSSGHRVCGSAVVAPEILASIDGTLGPLLQGHTNLAAGAGATVGVASRVTELPQAMIGEETTSAQGGTSLLRGLYEGMPVPPLLLGAGTPRECFAFLEADL